MHYLQEWLQIQLVESFSTACQYPNNSVRMAYDFGLSPLFLSHAIHTLLNDTSWLQILAARFSTAEM